MHKEQITDRRRANGPRTASKEAVERSRRQQASPGRTVACGDVRYAAEECAEEVYGSAAVDVREGGDQQWAYAREDDVHG